MVLGWEGPLHTSIFESLTLYTVLLSGFELSSFHNEAYSLKCHLLFVIMPSFFILFYDFFMIFFPFCFFSFFFNTITEIIKKLI
ncbi:hypothetical protein BDZ91DRAFT_720602 [Kalaharituber pfeilii]|nr:hypothetical protein BDZ91DRAFT_720602 [Kalaharituber pfeilii]